MSILTASGNDLDTVELRNMLDHWMSSARIRHLIKEKKILTEKKVDEIIAKDRAGLLDKGGLARIVRSILLNKDCRRHIAMMIVSTHPTENQRDMEKQLLRYAAEVKDLARMGASGLLTDAGSRDSKPLMISGTKSSGLVDVIQEGAVKDAIGKIKKVEKEAKTVEAKRGIIVGQLK